MKLPHSERMHSLIVVVLLLLAVSAVYWPVGGFDFVYLDDDVYVFRNPHVLNGLNAEGVAWAFTSFHGGFWIPLTWISYMADVQLFGLNPGWFHLTNLFLHLAASLLLFPVLFDMSGRLWRSALVAALFALHPLHVESVAWVAERKDVLSALFLILTIGAYVRYVRLRSKSLYLGAMVFFVLGLMSKPVLVTLPAMLLLLDYWPLGRFPRGDGTTGRAAEPISRLVLEKAPFFVLAAVSGAATAVATRQIGGLGLMEYYPLPARAANAVVSYVTYLGMNLWPRGLAVYYPYDGDALSVAKVAGAGAVLILVTWLVVKARRGHPYLVVGWVWYLVTLIPMVGLVQAGSQALADRFTYVPSIGLFIMVSWGISELVPRWRFRTPIMGAVATAVLLALSLASYRQVGYWRNTVTLLERAIAMTDDSRLAHYNLGGYFVDRQRFADAERHFSEALRLDPSNFETLYNLGVTLAAQGKIAAAVGRYREALLVRPEAMEAHVNLGAVLRESGRAEEALAHFQEALRLDPAAGTTYVNLGLAYAALSRWGEAAAAFRRALALSPDDPEAHYNLGYVSDRQGNRREALEAYSLAVRLRPAYSEARFNLALLQVGLGDSEAAMAQYRALLSVDPAWAARLRPFVNAGGR